jgi:hypothetical protein
MIVPVPHQLAVTISVLLSASAMMIAQIALEDQHVRLRHKYVLNASTLINAVRKAFLFVMLTLIVVFNAW